MLKNSKHKFNAKVTYVDGIKFPSKKEARRYRELKVLERAGVIKDLKLQSKFKLTEKQKRSVGKARRARYYIADFEYIQDGKRVIEDAKGYKTDVYKLKNILMFEKYGIEIKEV